jgi:hypothetical protein
MIRHPHPSVACSDTTFNACSGMFRVFFSHIALRSPECGCLAPGVQQDVWVRMSLTSHVSRRCKRGQMEPYFLCVLPSALTRPRSQGLSVDTLYCCNLFEWLACPLASRYLDLTDPIWSSIPWPGHTPFYLQYISNSIFACNNEQPYVDINCPRPRKVRAQKTRLSRR